MWKNVVYWTFKSYALCISETLCADNSQFLYHHRYLFAPGSLHSLLALMHIHALYSFAIVARNPTQPNHEVISTIVYVDFTLSTSLWELIVIIYFFLYPSIGVIQNCPPPLTQSEEFCCIFLLSNIRIKQQGLLNGENNIMIYCLNDQQEGTE